MSKLEMFLEKIYNNSANPSLFFYIILGCFVLLLILVIVYASIKPEKEKVKKDKEKELLELEEPKIEKKEFTADEIITNIQTEKTLEKPVIKDQTMKEKEIVSEDKQYSSVYLDIKPLNKDKKDLSESKTAEIDDLKQVEDLSINPDLFKEKDETKTIPNLFENIVDSKEKTIKKDSPVINLDIPQKEKAKKNFSKMVVLDSKKEPSLDITPESIKAKLESLSKKNEKNEKDLDNILKEVGVKETPQLPKMKDEESVLLGK